MTSTKSRLEIKHLAKEATKNYLSSANFMKRVTTICLSAITYMRGLFPEDSFVNEDMAGIKLRIIKEKPSSESAKYFSKSLKSVFSAFDKKYLRKLILSIHKDRNVPESLIEFYVFNYKYDSNGAAAFEVTTGNTKKKIVSNTTNVTKDSLVRLTQSLVRTCIVMINAQKMLPECYDVSIQLYYYDEVTPVNYEPEGFVAIHNDTFADNLSKAIPIGRITTNHHDLEASAYHNEDDDKSEAENEIVITTSPQPMEIETESRSATEENVSVSERNLQSADIKCICGRVSDVEQDVIQCGNCNLWQHGICYGFLPGYYSPKIKEHFCYECTLKNSEFNCADPNLLKTKPRRIKMLCMFKKALVLCFQHRAVNTLMVRDFLNVNIEFAAQLMRKLEKLHIFEPLEEGEAREGLENRNINIATMKSVLPKYFIFENDFEQTEVDPVATIEKMLMSMSNPNNKEEASTEQSCNNPKTLRKTKEVERSSEVKLTERTDSSLSAFRNILSGDKSSQEYMYHPSDIMDCELPKSQKDKPQDKTDGNVALEPQEECSKDLTSRKRSLECQGPIQEAKKLKTSLSLFSRTRRTNKKN